MSTNKYNFQNLTPIDDADISIYEDALNYVFSNNEIKNVAISGSYSAGKSSIIETYKKNNTNLKFLHISLAHFQSSDNGSVNFEDQDGNSLEGKILNQLIHQIEPDKIPQTKFNIKKELSEKDTHNTIAYFVVLLVSILLIFNFSNWKEYVNSLSVPFVKSILSLTTHPEFLIPVAIISLVLLIVISYKIIKIQYNKNLLKKVAFQGNEIELFEQENDSYFDKYLNEIIYLFENCGANVIVFEDMDRFNSNEIFQRLREVNILVNNKRNDNSPIRFFYLLKDDIFSSKDRTKFFDFILPIIPIVDSSNAYDKFIEHFKDGGIFELFNEEFLQGISLYIDDMRILKNIQNEFQVYKDRIAEKPAGQDNNKLLAMIAYKNLFPRDFNDLQVRKGYVYTLFASKELFVSEQIQKLKADIQKINGRIQEADKEWCRNVEELNALFFSPEHIMRVNNKTEKNFGNHTDFVKALWDNPDKVERRTRNDYTEAWQKYDPKPLFEMVQNNTEYQKRRGIVESRTKENKARLYVDKNQKEERIKELEQAELKTIVKDDNKNRFSEITYKNSLGEEKKFEDVKRSPYFELIQYLIREGYIDETYSDYMTYFYENSMFAEDRAFMRSVFSGNAQPYNYVLRNPARVIKELSAKYFVRKEILNFNLLDSLLEDENRYDNKLSLLLQQIYMDEPEEFVSQYLCGGKNRRSFTRKMNEMWDGMCGWILTTEQFTSVRVVFIIDTLCVCSPEVIKANDETGMITFFLENEIGTLDFPDEDVEKVMEAVELLDIKIKAIDHAKVNSLLLKEVYQKQRYVLNAEWAEIVYRHFYNENAVHLNWNTALTNIFNENDQPLARYVRTNISTFIKEILEKAVDICDAEEVVLYVLNEMAIEQEDKLRYVQKLETKITFLEDVNDITLWEVLLQKDRIAYSAENMCDYFFESGNELDGYLLDYINNSDQPLTVENINLDEVYGEKSNSKMFGAVAENQEIENSRYEKLVCSFKRFYTVFTTKGFPQDKLQVLLKNRVIRATVDNIKFLREEYPEFVRELIEYDTKSYLELIEENDIFMEDELECIMNLYPTEDISINDMIIELAEKHIDYILQAEPSMRSDMRQRLLSRGVIDEDQCKELITAYLPEMTKSEVVGSLTDAQLWKFIELSNGKRPVFKNTRANKRLLNALTDQGIISSCGVDKHNSQYLRAYGKRRNI